MHVCVHMWLYISFKVQVLELPAHYWPLFVIGMCYEANFWDFLQDKLFKELFEELCETYEREHPDMETDDGTIYFYFCEFFPSFRTWW